MHKLLERVEQDAFSLQNNDDRLSPGWMRAALARVDAAGDVTERTRALADLIAGISAPPRADLDIIEASVGRLRDLISMREHVLAEALDQHVLLSREAIRGTELMRKALTHIHDSFSAAMVPTPVMEEPTDPPIREPEYDHADALERKFEKFERLAEGGI